MWITTRTSNRTNRTRVCLQRWRRRRRTFKCRIYPEQTGVQTAVKSCRWKEQGKGETSGSNTTWSTRAPSLGVCVCCYYVCVCLCVVLTACWPVTCQSKGTVGKGNIFIKQQPAHSAQMQYIIHFLSSRTINVDFVHCACFFFCASCSKSRHILIFTCRCGQSSWLFPVLPLIPLSLLPFWAAKCNYTKQQREKL